ncbi:tRNA (adenosine(37)-N6)-threonylcarbamoyltransferase complex ATPase subunit type 1 TsaE [Halobacteriovorax sp. GB3]|uniref:tRNA (adenosine(37)-N6)-threonylcarbamoyltransferase complex ATPase subunit type 1 TsaE n=1 Tax=Halobacteriovorax sp. GB3 TaxID=2719615 RepID=UPI00235DF9C3|nr:tRNA (adenosine(37)-N6)-threonylcarbamoyltransferase complex ATPase subunit type 1 TsaE [Halobacteriovorax sp. GB3]MDD0853204.1 tRNA (adenosine(37)-N6)-threonylcarbamoyltransferase complex ATPase subunit type 1 TsaE [Halobacteriovorax sp. GB3]
MKLLREWKKVFESDLENLASELKETVDTPAVIILSGPVGAGKTTFTKHFISFDSKNEIQSPTYSLINEFGDCAHADLYRLESKEDIVHLEIELYLEGKTFFLVEWGMDYARELSRHVPYEFSFYELALSINNGTDQESRNFLLSKLDL